MSVSFGEIHYRFTPIWTNTGTEGRLLRTGNTWDFFSDREECHWTSAELRAIADKLNGVGERKE